MSRMWILLVALAAMATGCGQETEQAGEAPGQPRPRLVEAAAPLPSPAPGQDVAAGTTGVASGAGAGGGVPAAVPEIPAVGPTVIKTADLEVEVEAGGFREALDRATQTATRQGGFVVTSAVRGKDARRGSLTLRVPAESFEEALSELRALGAVRRERITGEDVGQEFVDLEARLRNLEAQETVLLRLFDEAVSVADTIQVQRELSGVQLQIEEIQGRLRFLRDQTSLSTITVSLVEEGADEPGFFGKAWDTASRGFLGVIAALVVVLGYAIPVVILVGLAFLGYRWIRDRWAEPEASSPSGRGGPPRRKARRPAKRS